MKTYRITARYTENGDYWGEDVEAISKKEAEAIARVIMEDNGDDDPEHIEIVDCDEIDLKAERRNAIAIKAVGKIPTIALELGVIGDLLALVHQLVPGGISQHEFSRPGGWLDRAKEVLALAEHPPTVRTEASVDPFMLPDAVWLEDDGGVLYIMAPNDVIVENFGPGGDIMDELNAIGSIGQMPSHATIKRLGLREIPEFLRRFDGDGRYYHA